MKKIFLLSAAAVFAVMSAFSQVCQQNNGLFLGTAVAPCSDTPPVGVDFFEFEVWRGDQYTWTNLKAGGNYRFDICQGTGGNAWDAVFTVVDPLGDVIANGINANGCALSFTATVDGAYDVFVTEAGVCPPAVLTEAGVDNGIPRLGFFGGASCDPPVTTCEAGTNDGLTESIICPEETSIVSFSGTIVPNSPTLGDAGIEFVPVDPLTSSTGTIYLGGFETGDEDFEFDSGLNGVLAANDIPAFVGEYDVKLVVLSNDTVSPFLNSNRCDSTASVTIEFLPAGAPGCAPPPVCEAGNIASAANQSVCPGDDVVLELTGEDFQDAANIVLVWLFIDTVSGDVFALPLDPESPATYNFTGDLNAELALAELDVLPPGDYLTFAGVFDTTLPDGGGYCDFTDNDFILTILDENDPECGGVPECTNPYPQVPFESLSTAVNPNNGNIVFQWDPIAGQLGCQVNVIVGALAASSPSFVFTIGGANASSFQAPGGQLNIGTTYNFRVRCGCQKNPLVIGQYTQFSSIFYLGAGGALAEQSEALNRTEYLSSVAKDRLLVKNRFSSTGDLSAVPTYIGIVEDTEPAMYDVQRNVEVQSHSGSFEVFPNPSSGAVNLNYDALNEGLVNVRLFDIVGKSVADFTMAVNKGKNFLNFDISSFEKGIYIIEVREGLTSSSAKVVLK